MIPNLTNPSLPLIPHRLNIFTIWILKYGLKLQIESRRRANESLRNRILRTVGAAVGLGANSFYLAGNSDNQNYPVIACAPVILAILLRAALPATVPIPNLDQKSAPTIH
jgi:hypothetical protein